MRTSVCFIAVATLLLANEVSADAGQGFFENARADLTATNFYYNRDYRGGTGQNKREEWAQGFIIGARSGYTPGVVGFGVDLLGLSDFKLDGVPSEVGTGILPFDDHGARQTFGRIAATAKAKAGPMELKVGSHIAGDLVLKSNTSRLLPQTFEGESLAYIGPGGLELDYERYDRSWYRDGTEQVRLTIFNKGDRFRGTPDAESLQIGSVTYRASDNVKLHYEYGELADIYRQQVLSTTFRHKWTESVLQAELRYYVSDDVGAALAGPVNNRAINALVTWQQSGHEFGVAYQGLRGATAMPWTGGTDGNVFNWTFINDFMERDERSWQFRYQLDGAKLRIPGLKFLFRYVYADHAHPAASDVQGREWQRDFELSYAFQLPAVKHFSVRWRNGFFRSNFQRNAEENRLEITYRAPLWGDDSG